MKSIILLLLCDCDVETGCAGASAFTEVGPVALCPLRWIQHQTQAVCLRNEWCVQAHCSHDLIDCALFDHTVLSFCNEQFSSCVFTVASFPFFQTKPKCLCKVLEVCLLDPKWILLNGSKWIKEIWLVALEQSSQAFPTVSHSLLPGSCLAVSHGRWAWPGSRRPVAVLQGAALQQCRSLALAASMELEGWLLMQQCLSMKKVRGGGLEWEPC